MNEVTLMKAIVVPNKNTLPKDYRDFYVEKVDMYVFSSEILYDLDTRNFSGRLLLHDSILRRNNLNLSSDEYNFVSVELDEENQNSLKLYVNRRCKQLSEDQIDYLKRTYKIA